ncbi:4a-hydroxytetrahydrobiopterin dehydratase [Leptolyngbya sp. 15MV]|nr:4a-hydroxytetrahydrobiopterin dehydratase [Leptolyngbya sp. 15MV]
MSGSPPPKMTQDQIDAALQGVPEWSESSGSIQRTFTFPNFIAAMAFVDAVARIAEADQHHPDILIRYNRVTLTVNTHDAGGITIKDFALARQCDALLAPPKAADATPKDAPARKPRKA